MYESIFEYLVSVVYSGYGKSLKDSINIRAEKGLPLMLHVFCNAHARRYFKQAGDSYSEEAKFYISQYRKIYRLEGIAKKNPQKKFSIRSRQRKYFEKIRDKCVSNVAGYSSKSSIGKAMNYFLKNYEGFTRFTKNPALPIDNNSQERLLRSPVVGRKTWYGTHSKRGAETAAILFSLVESCKLNQVNPREYFKNLVQDLHQGKPAYTPRELKDLQKNH
jgi:hypothetical protein